MKRMFSEEQIEALFQHTELSEEQINQINEELIGEFVKIISAPTSTTLTDETINFIKEGVFVEGEFLGYKNPVFFPAWEGATTYYGVMFANKTNDAITYIRLYSINKATKVIGTTGTEMISFDNGSNKFGLYGKQVPSYPASQDNKTYSLKLVNGNLSWVEEA